MIKRILNSLSYEKLFAINIIFAGMNLGAGNYVSGSISAVVAAFMLLFWYQSEK